MHSSIYSMQVSSSIKTNNKQSFQTWNQLFWEYNGRISWRWQSNPFSTMKVLLGNNEVLQQKSEKPFSSQYAEKHQNITDPDQELNIEQVRFGWNEKWFQPCCLEI